MILREKEQIMRIMPRKTRKTIKYLNMWKHNKESKFNLRKTMIKITNYCLRIRKLGKKSKKKHKFRIIKNQWRYQKSKQEEE